MRQYNPHDLCKRLYDLYGDLLGPEEKELLEKHIRGMFDTCSVSFEQDGDQPDNIASQMNNRNGEVAEADALRIGSYRYVDGKMVYQVDLDEYIDDLVAELIAKQWCRIRDDIRLKLLENDTKR